MTLFTMSPVWLLGCYAVAGLVTTLLAAVLFGNTPCSYDRFRTLKVLLLVFLFWPSFVALGTFFFLIVVDQQRRAGSLPILVVCLVRPIEIVFSTTLICLFVPIQLADWCTQRIIRLLGRTRWK